MTRNLIEFHADRPERFPAPYPASRGVPQWMKELPVDRPLQQPAPQGARPVDVPTVKQCPPFLEAMTCGYVIPLAGEVTFTMDAAGALNFTSQGKIVDTQHPLQVRG